MLILFQIGSIYFLIMGVASPFQTKDDNSARLVEEEQKLRIVSGKLKVLEAELRQLDTSETSILGDLHRLSVQIGVAKEQIRLLKIHLDRGYREINEMLAQIQILKKSVENLKQHLAERLASIYKLGRLSYARLLLSVKDPMELTQAYRYISRLARVDAEKIAQFLFEERVLQESKAELLRKTETMSATRERMKETRSGLNRRQRKRTLLLSQIRDQQEMAEAIFHELEGARENLGRLVQELEKGQFVDETVFVPIRAFVGELGWPVEGQLESRFGQRLHPRFKTVTVNNGIQFRAPAGNVVHAVYDGEVVFASWFEGYGNLLILSHPENVYSLYGYLEDYQVHVGEIVRTGQSVALVGDTGSLDGTRLYFEIRVEGEPVDPEDWLDRTRRLARAK